MYAKRYGKMLVLLCGLVVSMGAQAAKFSVIRCSDVSGFAQLNIHVSANCRSILIKGPIEKGDAKRFLQLIDAIHAYYEHHPKISTRVVVLDSAGGNLETSIKIGRAIRVFQRLTYVSPDSICYSACVFMLAGGVLRIALGKVGIHYFYSPKFLGSRDFLAADKQYNRTAAEIRDYLHDMRVPEGLLDAMMRVPSDKLRILSLNELQDFALIGADPVYVQTGRSIQF